MAELKDLWFKARTGVTRSMYAEYVKNDLQTLAIMLRNAKTEAERKQIQLLIEINIITLANLSK